MAVISAADSESVADHSFDHERVFEVTDAAARLRLPPLDACNTDTCVVY